MKPKITAILTILLLFNFAVLAQEEADITDVEEETGLQPDSSLYFLDKAADSLKLAFTFNEEKKARLELKVANERLKEVNSMIQRNRVESALKAQEAYKKRLEQAKNRIQNLKDNVNAEVITDLEAEIESQELLVEDIDTASLLPNFKGEDKIKAKEMIKAMKQVSKETREKLQERKEELIQARTELKQNLQELKTTTVRPEIQNRINMLEKKIETSKKILEKRTDTTAEETSNLELAKTKLEEAKAALEAGNYEEAKALTLEVNKLAVLVRSNNQEAQQSIRDVKQIALTREKIQERTEALERKQVKTAIETLKEREEALRERQQQITVKKEQLEGQERTITNVESNSDVETATQQERS